jgi:hypothetical protein
LITDKDVKRIVRRDHIADVRQNLAIVSPEPAHFPIPPVMGPFVSIFQATVAGCFAAEPKLLDPGSVIGEQKRIPVVAGMRRGFI